VDYSDEWIVRPRSADHLPSRLHTPSSALLFCFPLCQQHPAKKCTLGPVRRNFGRIKALPSPLCLRRTRQTKSSWCFRGGWRPTPLRAVDGLFTRLPWCRDSGHLIGCRHRPLSIAPPASVGQRKIPPQNDLPGVSPEISRWKLVWLAPMIQGVIT